MQEKRKKIVFVCGFFPLMSGGAEYQAYLLARRLQAFADVSFIYVRTAPGPQVMQSEGFTLYALPKKTFWRRFGDTFFLYIPQVNRLLKKIQPDIIYQRVASGLTGGIAHYGKTYHSTTIWHIASAHDVMMVPVRAFSRYWVFDLFNRYLRIRAIKEVTYVIAQANYQDQMLRKVFHRAADLIIGNFHPDPEGENRPQRRVRNIVWLANIKPNKHPEIFAMLARHFQNFPDVRFIMIGRDTKQFCMAEQLPNLIGKGELSQEQVNLELQKGYVLVNTSEVEGFPNTFIQAWQRYLPVLSVQVDPDNILQKHKLGVCSGTPQKLISDLQELLDFPEIRDQQGGWAHDYAAQYHSLSNIEKMLPYFGAHL